MATDTTNNFDIPKDGYVAFDAMSLRQLIINRLNEQKIFTDQNFLGSNIKLEGSIVKPSAVTPSKGKPKFNWK